MKTTENGKTKTKNEQLKKAVESKPEKSVKSKEVIKEKTNKIFIRTLKGFVRVLISDILYCDAYLGGVKIFMKNGDVVESDSPLKEFVRILERYCFFKNTKSQIANCTDVAFFDVVNMKLHLNETTVLDIAKSKRKLLEKCIAKNSDAIL